jgi:hypothetical protein
VQALADLIGERHRFRVTENLNRFARGVYYHPAVAAAGKMLFEIDSNAGVEDSVEIAR